MGVTDATASPRGARPEDTRLDWFVERREVTEVLHQRSGLRVIPPVLDQGWSMGQTTPDSMAWQWAQVAGARWKHGLMPEALAYQARPLLDAEPRLASDTEAMVSLVRQLEATARAAGAQHLDVLLREVERRTLSASDAHQREDHQRHALLEVKAFHDTGAGMAELWRCAAWPDVTGARTALPSLEALVESMARELRDTTPMVPCPRDVLPIVFPPGAASGCFFHEVCGHPLEGDVVARGGSYLARRLGQQVAGAHLSVSDDPTDGHGALGFAWDDEGHAALPVTLIREGRVDAPLLDARSAAALGRAPNGHGRRVSYRHPPLPRMAHTRVDAHQGHLEALMADIPHGLLVQHLTPRQMDLLSGDFSFYIVEAREIRNGRPGRRVGPGILRGNGLEALAAIDAVGADTKNLFATRGCRKLDHGPLPVSFGQPTVRFRGLTVEPSR
ncbi:TldD/PmbA family protein [Myxococcus xanthus DK 1622]|uniref:TldD/PmbA family protein n=1 Tax=Myxococcus xanthus (strain DK1622) TaxID=246197 RepID=Q1DBV7_MYXXD|nr:TldD/PmbA family protein [Myxococcus xanthus DK 1622]NOJ51803.1 TldD/PmbA family protein [Myxococcus xanthus]QPM81244.1 TldD/PmbA family protein [Myxococcus xanthus]QVW70303.1 TldD/PmbA family protein [Myxococcus xanthus DZ2]UEO03567.1 TldD/PmbA family protein [Myxococcus xanthus DZ2]